MEIELYGHQMQLLLLFKIMQFKKEPLFDKPHRSFITKSKKDLCMFKDN